MPLITSNAMHAAYLFFGAWATSDLLIYGIGFMAFSRTLHI